MESTRTREGYAVQSNFFLPLLLPNKNRIIYADTDILFLDAPSKLWSHFVNMKQSHMMALAREYKYGSSYFSHYPTESLNSGVILMDLNNMRENKFQEMAFETYDKMHNYYLSSDQDIFDIILGHFPEKLLIIPQQFNWLSFICGDLQGVILFCNFGMLISLIISIIFFSFMHI